MDRTGNSRFGRNSLLSSAKLVKKEAESFLNKAKEFQDIVSSFPNASIKSPKRKSYRLGMIHPYISAVYKIDPDRITIISLIDNRSKSKYR